MCSCRRSLLAFASGALNGTSTTCKRRSTAAQAATIEQIARDQALASLEIVSSLLPVEEGRRVLHTRAERHDGPLTSRQCAELETAIRKETGIALDSAIAFTEADRELRSRSWTFASSTTAASRKVAMDVGNAILGVLTSEKRPAVPATVKAPPPAGEWYTPGPGDDRTTMKEVEETLRDVVHADRQATRPPPRSSAPNPAAAGKAAKVETDLKTICIAAQKGGAGKTTLAQCLAVEALRQGMPSAIVDLDPQHSAMAWGERRTEREIDAPAVVTVPANTTLRAVVEDLQGRGAEFIIIDTPPHAAALINETLAIATRPSWSRVLTDGSGEPWRHLVDRAADEAADIDRSLPRCRPESERGRSGWGRGCSTSSVSPTAGVAYLYAVLPLRAGRGAYRAGARADQ